MKRNIKRMVALLGVVLTVVCSVAPSYYVYAEDPAQEPASQEVTSDDNIIQKLFYYSMSSMGALNRNANNISALPTTIVNSVKETLASLMNGGGIYVDNNGDYVFTDEACDDIYSAMRNNSSVDANVISNFSNFTYLADGYVNADFITACNGLTAYYNTPANGITDNVNNGNGTSGEYLLMSSRVEKNGVLDTIVYCFDIGNVAFITLNNGINFYDSSSASISVPYGYIQCAYATPWSSYYNDNGSSFYRGSSGNPVPYAYYGVNPGSIAFGVKQQYIYYSTRDIDGAFNSFPNYPNADSVVYFRNETTTEKVSFYSNRSLIVAKSVVEGTSLSNQTDGVMYSTFDNRVVNKTILESNNWENIYNSYVQNVNIDYQKDTSITPKDVRKIMKKYTGSIIDAIQSGSADIEESISITNRYLQAISTDVRNITEQLSDISNGGSGGGGMTEEQYNSIMGKLDNINDNALDIASSTATISSDIDAIYEDTHGIFEDMAILLENTGDTNTNLVAIDTLLQQINNKLRNRRTDNPLPDPDFWDNLDDELDDYTNTMMEDLVFKLQMIGTVLQGVVPFGYLVVLNVMVNALSEEPEEPVFEIDLQSNGATAIPINWQGTIDLSWVNDIMPIVRSFEVILFIIGLIWATFSVFTALGSLL